MIDPPPSWAPLDQAPPEPLVRMPCGDAVWRPSSHGRPAWLAARMLDEHAPWAARLTIGIAPLRLALNQVKAKESKLSSRYFVGSSTPDP